MTTKGTASRVWGAAQRVPTATRARFAEKPATRSAALASAGLSALFLALYGGCNWITAQRHEVGIWYYSWERFIPFVPLFIVPYWSLDLFFVAAPFLCRSRAELSLLARRLGFALLVASVFFLLIPLKPAVPRPSPGGWTGALFRFLHGVDRPYNLFPSLHITLQMILAELYGRHARRPVRVLLYVWFTLIGLSTLLTYQHHVVDVLGGFALAVFCFYLVREESPSPPFSPNRRVGGYYALASVTAIALAMAGWPWTAVLLWPALSLGLTAAAYWGLGPGIYRKTQGRIPLSARLLLAPCLLGQYVSLCHYRRRCGAWNALTPRVWIGARLRRDEAREVARQGVTAVLDLTAEFSETRPLRELVYRNLTILDLTAVSPEALREAVSFITTNAERGVVYVHCKIGFSRTAAVAGAWLLATGQVDSVEKALEWLRRVRPGIVLRPEVAAAIATSQRPERKLPYLSVTPTTGWS